VRTETTPASYRNWRLPLGMIVKSVSIRGFQFAFWIGPDQHLNKKRANFRPPTLPSILGGLWDLHRRSLRVMIYKWSSLSTLLVLCVKTVCFVNLFLCLAGAVQRRLPCVGLAPDRASERRRAQLGLRPRDPNTSCWAPARDNYLSPRTGGNPGPCSPISAPAMTMFWTHHLRSHPHGDDLCCGMDLYNKRKATPPFG